MPSLTDLPASQLDDEQRAIHRVADRYLQPFTDSLARALSDAGDQLSLEDVERVLLTGTQDQLTRLVDDALVVAAVGRVTKQEGSAPVVDTIATILIDGAQESAGELPTEVRSAGIRLAGSLNVANPAAVDRARRLAGQMISRISFESREAIRSIIAAGLSEGSDIPTMAREVKQVIGLDSRSARALRSYRRKLSENLGAGRTFDLRSRFSLAPARLPAGTAARVTSAADRLEVMSQAYRERLLRHRATVISRTEVLSSSNSGQRLLWDTMAREGVLDVTRTRIVWIATASERTCEICWALDGKTIGFHDEFVSDTLGAFGEPQRERDVPVTIGQTPPAHVQCLPGDTHVSSRHRVTGVSERHFEGDLRVILTAGGKELRATPNHPVLTDRGWVPAGLLNEGDRVVCDTSIEWPAAGRIVDDDENVPPLIHQVADAFRVSPGVVSRRVPVSAEDFHGDGEGSQVAVVRADRELWDGVDAAFGEHPAEPAFASADVVRASHGALGALDQLPGRGGPAAAGVMCGRHLAAALLGGHAGPLDGLGLALAADVDPVLLQAAADHPAADAVSLGDGVLGLPVFVPGDEFRDGQVDPLRHAAISSRSPLVNTDSIVSVYDERGYRGQVYNMETDGGYYSANGIVVHNCRCSQGLAFD